MVIILRMCVAPLLHLLQGDNTAAKMSEAAENEYRLTLKDQGRDCFQKSEFSNASALYLKAAQSGEQSILTATILRNIGMCHSILGNFSKASVFFAASSCLEPQSLKSYYQLSKSMMESESVEEAFEICKGAIPHFPKDSI